ncbi:MAG: ATP-dependent Clp protease ATP-binding subunit, partial [Myxococcota bacterium]
IELRLAPERPSVSEVSADDRSEGDDGPRRGRLDPRALARKLSINAPRGRGRGRGRGRARGRGPRGRRRR